MTMSGEDQQSWLMKFDVNEESVMGEQIVPDPLEVETMVSTSAEVCIIDNTILSVQAEIHTVYCGYVYLMTGSGGTRPGR